jgi:hypothetical protein
VDLADRRGGHRDAREVREVVGEAAAEVGLDDLAHLIEVGGRRGVAQLGQTALEALALTLGHEVEVDRAEDLADLHRRALHLPETRHELVGGLHRPRIPGGVAGVVVAHRVGRPSAQPARAGARDEAADAGGPAET